LSTSDITHCQFLFDKTLDMRDFFICNGPFKIAEASQTEIVFTG
jgi:hypothetical protein